MKTNFWMNDMCILFKHEKLTEIWPYKHMTYEEQLNATTRFVILVSLVGFMLLNNYIVLLLGLILIGMICIFYRFHKRELNESFSLNVAGCYSGGDKPDTKNPLQNVMLTDYENNVDKVGFKGDYTVETEQDINQKTKQFILDNNKDNEDMGKIFNEMGDLQEFENSMRQFHINPSTTIPNSQGDFLQFCYKNLYSEKPLKIY